jgi:hypothetical protein
LCSSESKHDILAGDNRLAFRENWSKWWRGFLDLAADESPKAVDFLRQR